jgi:hypothetical protein
MSSVSFWVRCAPKPSKTTNLPARKRRSQKLLEVSLEELFRVGCALDG